MTFEEARKGLNISSIVFRQSHMSMYESYFYSINVDEDGIYYTYFSSMEGEEISGDNVKIDDGAYKQILDALKDVEVKVEEIQPSPPLEVKDQTTYNYTVSFIDSETLEFLPTEEKIIELRKLFNCRKSRGRIYKF